MSQRLRELIRAVRACKTAAEERAVIAKECALIRTAFKDNNESFRHRNVAKLLFIHMLGYPSHWGQMECVRLIASQSFPEKRIGYLGLMLLLTEHEEVLTLVTNSIKNDLNHQNQFVVGLALTCVGNLATEDIARDLATDIDRLLRTSNSYTRKKAALAMARVLRKVPDLTEDFVDRITQLIKDRSHGVQITAIQLMIDVVEAEEEYAVHFTRLVPSLVRILRNLLSMGYSPDHDVSGITDPFLQVKLLRLLRLLGKSNDSTSDAMNDMLAQVATNTETAKNPGNAVLYECVQTIISVESEAGLRQLAINILGRFLLNRDNNIRYVALNVLGRVALDDLAAVQRHRNTIVECLKDPDVSLRQRALDLIYVMVQQDNVQELTTEMLNYLVVASAEQRASIGSHILDTVERFSPSAEWRVNTLITLLSIAGGDVDDAVVSSTVMYIAQEEMLYSQTVHKLFSMMKNDSQQLGLVHCAVWCIGEYGERLLQSCPASLAQNEDKVYPAVTASDVVEGLHEILVMHNANETTKSLTLTALAKLTLRFSHDPTVTPRISELVQQYKASMAVELQQRSVEYGFLLGTEPAAATSIADLGGLRNETLTRMPVIDPAAFAARRAVIDEDEDGEVMAAGNSGAIGTLQAPTSNGTAAGGSNLLDLDDIFGGSAAPVAPAAAAPAAQAVPQHPKTQSTEDILADIFSTPSAGAGASAVLAPTFAAPAQPTAQPLQPTGGDLLTQLGGVEPTAAPMGSNPSATVAAPGSGAAAPAPGAQPQAWPAAAPVVAPQAAAAQTSPGTAEFVAFEKAGLLLKFTLSKPDAADNTKTMVTVTFSNSSAVGMEGLVLQVATPKFLTLQMQPPSGTSLSPNNGNTTTQVFTLTNPQHGVKNLAVKLRIQYKSKLAVGGEQQITETAQVTQFPFAF